MNKIQRVGCMVGAIALLTIGASHPSAADVKSHTMRMSGTACQPLNSSDDADVNYLSTGIRNTSTTSPMAVYCPVSYDGFSIVDNSWVAWVHYYDQTTTASLYCRMYMRDYSGNLYTSPTVYSCSSSSGCSTADASYSSSSPNSMQLSDSSVSALGFGSFSVRCDIPGDGDSGVLGYTAEFDSVSF